MWEQIIVSMARQVGKSYLLRLLALWRMHHSHLFGGEPQLVLHTASVVVDRSGGDRPGATLGAGPGRPVQVPVHER